MLPDVEAAVRCTAVSNEVLNSRTADHIVTMTK